MRLSIDVGGTFTDLVLVDDTGERLFVDKVASTPGSGDAVVRGLDRVVARAGIRPGDLEIVFHGFTIATNAWLTRTGADVVLVVTEGFRDVLEIGTQMRPHTYDLAARKPLPLVARSRVVEVGERIDAFGNVVRPLDAAAVAATVAAVAALEPEAVAVSLLFGFTNPDHERALGAALERALPGVPVYLACDVNPQLEEYPRANTTAAAAYVGPPVRAYTGSLEASLASIGVGAPLLYMRSDGGAATSVSARANPATMLLSGPAGGVIAALEVGRLTGTPNLVSFDMGGTSADFAVVRGGKADIERGRDVDGLPLRIPMLEIKAISAGGGSIGWVDRGGSLRVGPRSAGAVPGPACYGQGGDAPTLTDAALVLGLLDPDTFAGGDIGLAADRAATVILRDVGEPLGLDLETAALGMLEVATASMGQAIRGLSVERGHDLAEFALLAFGGAGGLFAPMLLRDLGMAEVIVPRHPGVLAAHGLHFADVRHHVQEPFARAVRGLAPDEVDARLRALAAGLDADLARDGIDAPDRKFSASADVRYVGQHHQLEVAFGAAEVAAGALANLAADFHALHASRYGYSNPAAPIELTNLHAEGRGVMPKPGFATIAGAPGERAPAAGARRIYLGGGTGWCEADVYDRADLLAGHRIDGPAVVRQSDSTLVLLPGQSGRVDDHAMIHVTEARPA